MAETTLLQPANNNGPCLCQQIASRGGRDFTQYLFGVCTAGSYHLDNPADPLDTSDACGQQLTTLGLSYTGNFVALGGSVTGSGSLFTLEDASSTVTLTALTTNSNEALGGTRSLTVITVNAATLSYFLNIATTVPVTAPASTIVPAITNPPVVPTGTYSPLVLTPTPSSATGGAADSSSSPFLGSLLLAWSVVGWFF